MRDGPRCSRPSRSRLKGGPSCRNCVDSSKSVDFLPPSPLYTKEEEEEEDRGGEGGATEAALEFIKYHQSSDWELYTRGPIETCVYAISRDRLDVIYRKKLSEC